MMQLMWWRKEIPWLVIGGLILGCSPAVDTVAEPEAGGIHFSAAVSQLMQPKVEIEKLSSDLVNKTVQIEGTVQQHAPLLASTLYLLEDGTGKVWVLSSAPPPTVGDKVQVSGIVHYEQIVVSGADISEYYLQEQSRSPLAASTPEDPATEVAE
jgi:hypothetical protein